MLIHQSEKYLTELYLTLIFAEILSRKFKIFTQFCARSKVADILDSFKIVDFQVSLFTRDLLECVRDCALSCSHKFSLRPLESWRLSRYVRTLAPSILFTGVSNCATAIEIPFLIPQGSVFAELETIPQNFWRIFNVCTIWWEHFDMSRYCYNLDYSDYLN